MALTPQQKTEIQNKIQKCLNAGDPLEKISDSILGDGQYANNLEREEFIQTVKDLMLPADEGLEQDYKDQDIEYKSFSSSEKKERAELSDKALKAYLGCVYDHEYRFHAINKAIENGEISNEDMANLNVGRDTLTLLTYLPDKNGSEEYNIPQIQIASGKGLNPNDPNTPDDRNRMAANIWNLRLKELADNDFSKYLAYSDKELVDHWPEIYNYQQMLSVFINELDKIKRNPYVDLGIIERCLNREENYAAQYMMLIGKMRAICSPNYVTNDLDALLQADADKFFDFHMMNRNNPESSRFVVQAEAMRQGYDVAVQSAVFAYMKKANSINYTENIAVFDKDGRHLDWAYVSDLVKSGQVVYAVDLQSQKIKPVTINPRTLSVKPAAPSPEIDAATKVIASKVQEYVQDKSVFINDVLYGDGGTFDFNIHQLASEVNSKPELKKDDILKSITNHIRDKKGLTRDQLAEFFKSKGYNPPKLTEDEINQRRALTEKAIKVTFEDSLTRVQASSVPGTNGFGGITQRTFDAVCLRHGKGDRDYNIKMVERFHGSDEDVKKAVEEIFTYHLEREPLFDKSFSDEELIENWPELRDTGLAMGMEYVSFCDYLKKRGISIDPDIQKRADAFYQKVDSFNSYYKPRVDIISSKYYQYGMTELISDPLVVIKEMGGIQDNEFVRLKNGLYAATASRKLGLGSYIINQSKFADKNIVGVLGPDGTYCDAESYVDIGSLAEAGQPMILVDQNNKQYPLKVNGSIYPPVIEDGPKLDIVDQKIADAGLKIRDIQASNMNRYEKALQLDTLKSFKELMILLKEQKPGQLNERFRDCVGTLAANLAIEKMAVGKGMDDENLKFVSSKEMHEKYRDSIFASGLIEELMKSLEKGQEALPKATPDIMYKALVHCTTQLGLKEQRLTAKQRQDRFIEFRDASRAKAASLSQAFKAASKCAERESFFNGKVSEADLEALKSETKLTSMTVTRSSVQSLTTAMMLNNGYTVDEIFSSAKALDREIYAKNAMKLIATNETYVIREELIRGLNGLNKYVNDKMTAMQDFSLSELAKPENINLITASGFLKDMSQEFDNCQKQLDPNDKLNIPVTLGIQKKAEVLAMAISRTVDAKYNPLAISSAEINDELKHYITGQFMNKFIHKLKGMPENKDKKFDEITSFEENDKFMNAVYDKIPDIMVPKAFGSEANLQKLHDAMQDDSLKDFLNIDIKFPSPDSDEYSIEFTFETAIKNAVQRDALNKTIDLTLNEEMKTKEFVFQM